MSTNKSFPTYFPACCPPEQAVDANGLVFRIVKHENLTNADFLSHHELKTAMTADPVGVVAFRSLTLSAMPRIGKN